MITTRQTPETLRELKQIFDKHRFKLKPNRKSGEQINIYFCHRYRHENFEPCFFRDIVKSNILENDRLKEKLPQGVEPQIMTYKLKDESILVGIDLITGFFHVESDDTDRMAEIYDDLFIYRGLDDDDLNNYVLAGQYILLKGIDKS